MVSFNAGMHQMFEDCSGVLSRIMEESVKFACFAHYHDGAQRKHVHFYVEYDGSADRKKTWMNWIRKSWIGEKDVKGHDWWFPTTQKDKKSPVNEDVIVYMTKGKYKSLLTKGFTEEEIQAFSDRWVDPHAKVEAIRASVAVALDDRKRSKAKTQWDIQEEAIELLHDKYDTDAQAFKDVVDNIPPSEIYKAVRKVCHKYQKKVSDRMAIDLIQSIQSYGTRQEERIVKIFSKYDL